MRISKPLLALTIAIPLIGCSKQQEKKLPLIEFRRVPGLHESDSNRDDILNKEEARDFVFRTIDNGDGVLDYRELERIKKGIIPKLSVTERRVITAGEGFATVTVDATPGNIMETRQSFELVYKEELYKLYEQEDKAVMSGKKRIF